MMEIGEAFVGSGAEAAHMAVVRPGLAVKPATLFVNKAGLVNEEHSHLTWGAAQAGVAGGVLDAVAAGAVEADAADRLVLIAAVWVDPRASDEELVYANNRRAAELALVAGREGNPQLAELLAVRQDPANPFFRSSSA